MKIDALMTMIDKEKTIHACLPTYPYLLHSPKEEMELSPFKLYYHTIQQLPITLMNESLLPKLHSNPQDILPDYDHYKIIYARDVDYLIYFDTINDIYVNQKKKNGSIIIQYKAQDGSSWTTKKSSGNYCSIHQYKRLTLNEQSQMDFTVLYSDLGKKTIYYHFTLKAEDYTHYYKVYDVSIPLYLENSENVSVMGTVKLQLIPVSIHDRMDTELLFDYYHAYLHYLDIMSSLSSLYYDQKVYLSVIAKTVSSKCKQFLKYELDKAARINSYLYFDQYVFDDINTVVQSTYELSSLDAYSTSQASFMDPSVQSLNTSESDLQYSVYISYLRFIPKLSHNIKIQCCLTLGSIEKTSDIMQVTKHNSDSYDDTFTVTYMSDQMNFDYKRDHNNLIVSSTTDYNDDLSIYESTGTETPSSTSGSQSNIISGMIITKVNDTTVLNEMDELLQSDIRPIAVTFSKRDSIIYTPRKHSIDGAYEFIPIQESFVFPKGATKNQQYMTIQVKNITDNEDLFMNNIPINREDDWRGSTLSFYPPTALVFSSSLVILDNTNKIVNCSLKVDLKGIGLSVINTNNQEILYAYIESIIGKVDLYQNKKMIVDSSVYSTLPRQIVDLFLPN